MISPPRDAYSRLRSGLVVASAALALVLTLFFSNDYCFTALGAAICSLVVVYIVDRVFCATPLIHRRRQAYLRATIALAVPLMLTFTPFFRLANTRAFQTAFGMLPPAGIEDLSAQRMYCGGPGDYVIQLTFRANAAVIGQITAQREFEIDQQLTQWWIDHDRSWPALVARLSSQFGAARKGWWRNRPPLENPEFWLWRPSGTTESTLLIWDAESGRAYAAYGLG